MYILFLTLDDQENFLLDLQHIPATFTSIEQDPHLIAQNLLDRANQVLNPPKLKPKIKNPLSRIDWLLDQLNIERGKLTKIPNEG
jgi:hypothetical protein